MICVRGSKNYDTNVNDFEHFTRVILVLILTRFPISAVNCSYQVCSAFKAHRVCVPTIESTTQPTNLSTQQPTTRTATPSTQPSYLSTQQPTTRTATPSIQPSYLSTQQPTTRTATPSIQPTHTPTNSPTQQPTIQPTISPSFPPSFVPSISPSNTNNQQSDSSSGPSSPTLAIIGIVIINLIFILIVILVKRRRRKPHQQPNPQGPTMANPIYAEITTPPERPTMANNSEDYETPVTENPEYGGFQDFVDKASAADLTEDKYVASEQRQTLRLSNDQYIAPVTPATDRDEMRQISTRTARNSVPEYDLVEPDIAATTIAADKYISHENDVRNGLSFGGDADV